MPFRPGLRLALQPVMLGARLGIGRPLAIDIVAQGGDFLRQPFQDGNGLEFGLRRFKAAARFVKDCAMRRMPSSSALVCARRSAICRSCLASACRETSTDDVAARHGFAFFALGPGARFDRLSGRFKFLSGFRSNCRRIAAFQLQEAKAGCARPAALPPHWAHPPPR